MATPRATPAASEALRLARRAWRLLHLDSARAIALADKALAIALKGKDRTAEGWARLARGFHLLSFATPGDAAAELTRAQSCLDALGDRAGHVLAGTGLARALWRDGHFTESLEQVLPLRDEGLAVLKNEQRGVLLNTIAGCYSAQGQSELAFAYMYQALRDAGPVRGHGFDTVLHCNLAHELLQLGDYDEALRHVDQGLARSTGVSNPRLLAVLLINRVICLTELDRAREALPDIVRVRDLPDDATGRGTMAAHFETLAIAALRAGEVALGGVLVGLAQRKAHTRLPEERVELAIAASLLAAQRADLIAAAARLEPVLAINRDGAEGLSLRVRCLYFLTLSQLQERLGDSAQALASMRAWQKLHLERAQMASRARYQAATLQTELLRLQHKLDENDAKRRATERARSELAAINEQLSRKVVEVQSLQQALREQATRDDLTRLFNRRHLNDRLPAMFALAQRDALPLAVAIIDLDHFKSVNDHHGHGAGDTLLAAFGRLLADNCRKSDVACRYGGEEFCLLMPRTDAAAARRKINSLLVRWRAEAFRLDSGTLSGQTFSAGVSDSKRVSASWERLLESADAELLAAKRLGRNRVRVAEPPLPVAH